VEMSDEEVATNLHLALKEVNRMSEIINNMRVFVRREEFEIGPVDLGALLQYPFNFLASQLRAHGIRHVVTAPDGVVLQASENRLQQVLVNLVINARDAIQERRLRESGAEGLIVVNATADAAAGRIVIEVSDTGIGIAAAEAGKIFEPFYTTKDTGTGLGTAISYEIIKQHGGEISMRSEAGRGATFRIELPWEPAKP